MNIDFDFTVAHKQACSTEARRSPNTHTTITIEFKLIHKCYNTFLMALPYKHICNNHVSLIHISMTKNPQKTMLLYCCMYQQFIITILYSWSSPGPISLNGEPKRKCSETPPVTASRKDLEVMTTS